MTSGRITALLLSAVLLGACAGLELDPGSTAPTSADQPTTSVDDTAAGDGTAATVPTTAPDLTTTSTTSTVPTTGPEPSEPLIPDEGVARLVPEVVAVAPHDTTAFTQGLEHHDGLLFESTGQYGESDRRRVDPATGEVVASVALPDGQFGEGLTIVGDRLLQLTWREGVAHVVDPDTLEAVDSFTYEGEGWGLCYDGNRLVMSDGSSTLTFRDPDTFEVTGRVDVALEGEAVSLLNELECSDGLVWANVWFSPAIVAIAPGTGEVRAVVDASSLVPEGVAETSVLNGIARRPDGDTFWLTGKYWPVLYEVRLVPAPS